MKFLHLEDNACDAELGHEVFRAEWPDCEIELVDTREAFLSSLSRGGHDLILSDFNLVNFDGLEALKIARVLAPEVPFLYFSGTIGEERALEALREGAKDYVIKDRPGRLVSAIRRALDETRLLRERKESEEQMQRVQRLENLGMLAAGIAHDFNNVLAPVMMGIPLIKSRMTADTDRRILGNIESSVQRGVGLVRQILGFAHGVAGETQLVQPKHLFREIQSLLQQTFPKSVHVMVETDPELWPLKINPTRFHQVLLNLCVNARDAMCEGGTLTVRARNQTVAAEESPPAGDYLRIDIEDTGTGIPADVLERMWDPFFTTKEIGKGTGLGLATVRGIVSECGGAISVDTAAGKGTQFHMLFPAQPQALEQSNARSDSNAPFGSGEWILLADDDPNGREVASAALVAHGYRVLTAKDGLEALAVIKSSRHNLRVLVADLDMPNLDGAALAKVVPALNPGIAILLTSGSANQTDPRRQPTAGGTFLAKPFSADTLLVTLSDLLRGAASAA